MWKCSWLFPGVCSEEDDKMDVERLMNEVMMDRGYKEKLEMKAHVRIPKRVYISRENFKEFKFTARCPGRTSMLSGTAGRSHTEALAKTNGGGIERHFQGAQRCVKEYQECAAKERSQLLKRHNRDRLHGRRCTSDEFQKLQRSTIVEHQ